MKKNMFILCGLVGTLFLQGCASMFAHHQWKEANDANAIIVRGDGTEVQVGINFLSMHYLRDNWRWALAAAAADGLTAYGVYTLYDKNFSSSSGGSSSGSSQNINVSSGRDTTIIINNGDGNTFDNAGDTTTTTTSTF